MDSIYGIWYIFAQVKSILIVLISSFYITGLIAQELDFKYACGTEFLEDIKQEMFRNRETIKNLASFRGAVNYVPVKVNIVTFDDGSGNVPMIDVLRMMCQLNKAYADQNIQFYMKGVNTINNTTMTSNPKSTGGSLQLELNKDAKALNIYIVNKIDQNSNSTAGVTLAYYSGASSGDYVVSNKSYISDVRVVPHEVGHFFTLPHTFHGWDFTPWDAAKYANTPVGRFAPDGITLNENADSSNCGPKNVGDGFCDTPADYNFLNDPSNSTCRYSSSAQDPNGKPLLPQTNNFMNYFFGCSNYIFTPQQKDAILASYAATNRSFIRGTSPISTVVINSATKLVYPVNGSPTASADTTTLAWDAVPGATSYLVQTDIVPTFELEVKSYITTKTSLLIQGMTQNRTYHWRVIAYSDYSTCFPSPNRSTFKAGALTAVNDIPEVKSFAVFPNPVLQGSELQITLDNRKNFEGSITILDMNGRKIWQSGREQFFAGITHRSINVSAFSPGVYQVSLSAGQGLANRKIIKL